MSVPYYSCINPVRILCCRHSAYWMTTWRRKKSQHTYICMFGRRNYFYVGLITCGFAQSLFMLNLWGFLPVHFLVNEYNFFLWVIFSVPCCSWWFNLLFHFLGPDIYASCKFSEMCFFFFTHWPELTIASFPWWIIDSTLPRVCQKDARFFLFVYNECVKKSE